MLRPNTEINKHLVQYNLYPHTLPKFQGIPIRVYGIDEKEFIFYLQNKISVAVEGEQILFADWLYIRDICSSLGVCNVEYYLPATTRPTNILIGHSNDKMIWLDSSDKLPKEYLDIYAMTLNNPYIRKKE
ncbi:MAG: hypothetical protein WC679_02580 [Bacteroidales bacterium]|jgi:hypothetical protein